MRRLLALAPWLLAAGVSILTASDSAAQWRPVAGPRPGSAVQGDADHRQRDQWSRGFSWQHNSRAFSNGFEDGFRSGFDDGRDADRYDPVGERRYRSGDRRYNRRYGPKEFYRQDYRAGFRAGYAQGYREAWSNHGRRGGPWSRDGRYGGWRP